MEKEETRKEKKTNETEKERGWVGKERLKLQVRARR